LDVILAAMQFEALKIFCDVARFHSISQAAASNNLTQSAVSQLVRLLERRMGVELLDRSSRPLGLTPAGRRYYEGCRELVTRYVELESELRQSAMERGMVVQAAAIYSVGLRDMSHYITRFTALEPGSTVQIEYVHPDRVYEKVLDGTADLGLLSFPRQSREIVSIPWREEEMVLVCPPAHALARLSRISIGRLSGQRYVHFDKDLAIRKQVDRFLRKHGVRVEVVVEFDSIENIKHAIDVSAGVALLPFPTVEREVRAGALAAVTLADARLTRPLAIIYRRGQRLTTATRRFIDLLRQSDEADSAAVSPKSGRGRARVFRDSASSAKRKASPAP
jgi:DNA-binding transcriptional LysR family regulator